MNNFFLIISLFILSSIYGCKNETNNPSLAVEEDNIFKILTEKINKNPNNGELRYLRAKYLNDSERYDEAIIDMRDAVLLDSTQARYYHLLSDLFMDINNSSKALITIRTAGKLFPDSTLTQLKLSETLFILKEYQESILTINEIIRKYPQNAEAYFMLGLVFRETKEEAKAIKVAKKKSAEIKKKAKKILK